MRESVVLRLRLPREYVAPLQSALAEQDISVEVGDRSFDMRLVEFGIDTPVERDHDAEAEANDRWARWKYSDPGFASVTVTLKERPP
jgi:hypothetical protein